MGRYMLSSPFKPTGDQPQAIEQLATGVERGEKAQVLLGVTGSGKTFTMANVIERTDKPVLILSHNKTLAAQLYTEMRAFFPANAVEYYVSYYDYYQPEAYIPSTDTYIEKDLAINDEIDRLRLRATSALLSGRSDVIVVSSVSCIYGMGNPAAFYEKVITLRVGQRLDRNELLRRLLESLYVRNDVTLKRGEVRVKGDTVDIALAYSECLLRVTYWGDEIDGLEEVNPDTLHTECAFTEYHIYPANLFMTTKETQERAIRLIEHDLDEQASLFESQGKTLEAKRLRERVTYDVEMMRELGHCSGIENYSRYFDGREPGSRPFCLLDFFPHDHLLIIDESHVSVPQLRAMYGGDRARKENLVKYGFRLPAAMDNRPLTFEEFQHMSPQVIYVSATPADYELSQSGGAVVEQLIRPTGLLDPRVEVRPRRHEADDLIEEIRLRIEAGERTLVTALTRRQAEEFSGYLLSLGIKASYIHSEVDTLERVRILDELRSGETDVLVGVNLLREGLDLPEVSLVAILDADQEGFLRNRVSLTQTIGRAARNTHGTALLYADRISESIKDTLDESNRRRHLQMAYNAEHGITPTPIRKELAPSTLAAKPRDPLAEPASEAGNISAVAEAETEQYISAEDMAARIESLRKLMLKAAKELDFITAAQHRDHIMRLEEALSRRGTSAPASPAHGAP